MPAWKHHVFVCKNKRPPGHPKGSCGERGAQTLFTALRDAVDDNGLWETVKVTGSECLGPCRAGATVVVYPEGVWYSYLDQEDLEEIIQEHLIGGRIVQRLLMPAGASPPEAGEPS